MTTDPLGRNGGGPGTSIRVLGPEDEGGLIRYRRLHESCPAAFVQQSVEWSRVIAETSGDEPRLLLASRGIEDVGGLPIFLFRGPSGCVANSVPLPGPLGGVFCRPDLPPSMVREVHELLLSKAVELSREAGALTLTVISSPFAGESDPHRGILAPDWELRNFTQWIAVDEVVKGGRITLPDYGRRSNLSRNLRRSSSAGLTVTEGADDADFDAWYEIHRSRHMEIGATPIPRSMFTSMRRHLEPRGMGAMFLARKGSALAGGCYVVRHRDIADIFMLSMSPDHAADAPNYLLTESILQWAGRVGVRCLNWQSSPNRAGGVYRFKKQWGSMESGYSFLTSRIADLDRLQTLDSGTISRDFPLHFVVPFGVFPDRWDRKVFTKE